jgi:hypothetical protein
MFTPLTRRRFVVGTLQAGALAGLGDLAFLIVGLHCLPSGATEPHGKGMSLNANLIGISTMSAGVR